MALSWLQNDALTVFDSFYDHLRKRDVCEFELALVFLLLKADVENVHRSTERPNANLWTIRLPCNRCDWIVVFDLFAANLIPLRSLGIKVVDIKAVKVSNNGCFSSGIESSTCEFLHTLVLWVVKSLEAIASLFIEMNLSIVTSRQNVWAPS